jgi:hypothetical protein
MDMRRSDNEIDRLLRAALKSGEIPDPTLIRKVKHPCLKEEYSMRKPSARRSFSAAAIIAAVFLLSTATALAAWHFLKPAEAAIRLGNQALSAAFDSDTAVNINKSATSGDYVFTLLAAVSGNDITDMPYYQNGKVSPERTYAVIAIQNADGSPIDGGRGNGAQASAFFASPLVKGLKPWEVNAATMGGGYCETVVDGILYRLVECDDIMMFADRGLYFAICAEAFIHNGIFLFDEQTGEIGVNPDYSGASAVFDLPIDKSFANPAKAERYLNGLFAPSDGEEAPLPPEMVWGQSLDWEKAVPVASTIKDLAVADNGEMVYEFVYGDSEGTASAFYSDCFSEGGGAQSKIIRIDSEGYADGSFNAYAIRFSLSASGVVTGAVVIIE